MIAAVKGQYAAWAALVVICPLRARAADDPASAARELAAKTAGFAGPGATVAMSWRNASSAGSADAEQVRAGFEAALRQSGERVGDGAPVEIRLTLSENPTQYLLVEEARRGEERQVWIAAWKRGEDRGNRLPAGVSLERKLIWEQEEQILDVAFPGTAMVVLSRSNVTVYAKVNGQWEARQQMALTTARPWPRDLRGRLRVTGANFQAYLPGMSCSGTSEPVTMECRPSEEPWVLESGSRGLLLANFAASRNYFDGHVVAQNGTPRTVTSFYSAASVEDRGQTLWLLALVDGRVQVFDAALNPVAGSGVASWGSDIAGIDARCGASSQVLATKTGDSSEPDAIQAFSFGDRAATPASAPTTFSGPVTALWTSGGSSAVAVARDLSTGRYAAYILTVACGS